SCNETSDSIDHTPNNGLCDNGLFCDGSETCDAVLDCQAGIAPITDDGVGCTDDSCDEATDTIINTANDGNCDNGLFCDGAETCDAALDCQAGIAPVTDDGVFCTDDSCDEDNDVVVHTNNTAPCNDGDSCTSSDTCSGGVCYGTITNADGDSVALCGPDGVSGNGDDDCNDGDSSIYPGAPDAICDNVDNNCKDGPDDEYAVDNTCGIGACLTNNSPSTCVAGVETACQSGGPAADDATCNDVDDDCDGSTDEDIICAPTTYTIEFDMAGYNDWLPEDGNTATVTVKLVDDQGTAQDVPITLTYSITNIPGKYTNDASTDASDDFDTPVESAVGFAAQIDLISRDYGGSIIIHAHAEPTTEDILDVDFRLPKDTDADTLPDAYEILYPGDHNPGDDADVSDGSTDDGDDLSTFAEYRGFKWGPKMIRIEPTDVTTPANPYKTPALVLSAEDRDHFRTDPTRKDLFMQFYQYDYVRYDETTNTFTREYEQAGCDGNPVTASTFLDNCPFAVGVAYDNIGIDIHAYSLDAPPQGTYPDTENIDVVLVWNKFDPYSSDDNTKRRPASETPRDWVWAVKGYSGTGDATSYGSIYTYQKALDNYFGQRPYYDKNTLVNGGSGLEWDATPNNQLDKLSSVEDQNDNGEWDTGEDRIYPGGTADSLDGDYVVEVETASNYVQQLTVFDINNNGMVEHPLQGDPETVSADYQYMKAHALKHTITHEIGHAVGIESHTSDTTCIMNEPSVNWSRDHHFSDNVAVAKELIQIHNE
ncbi:MopE-related protein, partial [Thermodesulfobacteriota bacterium]